MEKVKEEGIEHSSERGRELLQRQIKEEVNEMVEREKRRNRIVISNLTTEDIVTPKEEMISKVTDLFQALDIPLEDNVGQIIQLKDRRFMSVELKNTEIKNLILRRSKTLRNKEQYKEV